MNNTALKILRYAWVFLFLWFGYQQIVDPTTWVGFLPQWLGYIPIPGAMIVQLNGWVEIVGAVFLLLGVWTRLVALLLSLHLLAIAWAAGGAIGIRDFILAFMGIAIGCSAPDNWTIDSQVL